LITLFFSSLQFPILSGTEDGLVSLFFLVGKRSFFDRVREKQQTFFFFDFLIHFGRNRPAFLVSLFHSPYQSAGYSFFSSLDGVPQDLFFSFFSTFDYLFSMEIAVFFPRIKIVVQVFSIFSILLLE